MEMQRASLALVDFQNFAAIKFVVGEPDLAPPSLGFDMHGLADSTLHPKNGPPSSMGSRTAGVQQRGGVPCGLPFLALFAREGTRRRKIWRAELPQPSCRSHIHHRPATS